LAGAKALGWEDRIGSIEAGKLADLTAIRLDAIETQPLYNVISQLVYAAGRHLVSDVWIAGARKLREGGLVDLDVAELRAVARRWRERISEHR
jgi:5-methylthioadenosine/S-adenosylhomocysteine deaminase